jgi:hypothetical protein
MGQSATIPHKQRPLMVLDGEAVKVGSLDSAKVAAMGLNAGAYPKAVQICPFA